MKSMTASAGMTMFPLRCSGLVCFKRRQKWGRLLQKEQFTAPKRHCSCWIEA
jgi:hypothetical protein